MTDHRVGCCPLVLHQCEGSIHIQACLIDLAQKGMQQGAIRERGWIAAVGLHHLIAAIECLIELTEVKFLKTGLRCQFRLAQAGCRC